MLNMLAEGWGRLVDSHYYSQFLCFACQHIFSIFTHTTRWTRHIQDTIGVTPTTLALSHSSGNRRHTQRTNNITFVQQMWRLVYYIRLITFNTLSTPDSLCRWHHQHNTNEVTPVIKWVWHLSHYMRVVTCDNTLITWAFNTHYLSTIILIMQKTSP